MADADAELTVTCTLAEGDMVRLGRTVLRRLKAFNIARILLGCVVPALGLAAACFAFSQSRGFEALFLALPTILVFFQHFSSSFFPLLPRAAQISSYRNNPAAQRQTTYQFSSNGIVTSNDLLRSDAKWEMIIEVLETESDFVFYVSRQSVILLPKSAIPVPQDRNRLRSVVRQNAGSRARLFVDE